MWFTIGCYPELVSRRNGEVVNAENYFKLNFLAEPEKLQWRSERSNQPKPTKIPHNPKSQFFQSNHGNPLIR